MMDRQHQQQQPYMSIPPEQMMMQQMAQSPEQPPLNGLAQQQFDANFVHLHNATSDLYQACFIHLKA
jgi:hypothetical protein